LAVFVLAGGLCGVALGDASSDPNLAVWYKLDESAGYTANDSSVYNRDGDLETWDGDGPPYPDPNWDPDGGHDGGCYSFFDETRITVPKAALSKVKDGITVSFWLKDAWRVGQNCAFDASAGEEATFRITAYIGTAPDAEVLWRAGDDSNDTLRWDMDGGSVENLLGWHHWTFVKDEVAGNIRIYLDGFPAASKEGVSNALATVLAGELGGSFYFRVGAKSWYWNDLKGKMDDFMVHDRAVSDAEVLRLYYSAGDLTVAWKPAPADDAEDLCENVVLSWTPGDYADEHDVYFGTDEQAVEDATTASAQHISRQEPNSYNVGVLAPGTAYYWRIDEVNDNVWAPPGSPWKGQVWQLTINDGNAFNPSPADGETAVLKEASLSWSAGCRAAEHDVYFGTDYDAVKDATTASSEHMATLALGQTSWVPPSPFDYLTDYYWRIDEVNGPTTWKGEVWSFKSQTLIVDVNCTLWYELNETEGYTAHDSSNYLNHGVVDMPEGGPPEWDPLEGQWGGSLVFDDDTAIWVPTAVLSRVVNGVGIIFWAKDASKIALNANGGDSQLLVDFGGGGVTWRAGNDTNDVLVLETDTSGWHYWAFVKDESEGHIRIYRDGALAGSDETVDSTLFDIRSKPFKVGGATPIDNDFDGKIDDFIVYDRALSENEIARQYETGGPVGKMGVVWKPTPSNGAIDVARDVQLTWSPGDYTQPVGGHELFFGTSWEDVNGMTTPTATMNLGNETYDPGVLELKTAYYWRVDEVNDPCTWRGQVWKFTVADFLIVDDFELYGKSQNQIFYTWYCKQSTPYGQRSGAVLDVVTLPVHSGGKAMQYSYETDSSMYWDQDFDYAEAWLPLEEIGGQQDWTEVGVLLLRLFFYGDSGNDATDGEQMYVGVEDSGGLYAELRYGDNASEDMNDLLIEEWQSWDIPLSYCSDGNFAEVVNDVNLKSIANLRIGFGNRRSPVAAGSGVVYFDDIRLNLPVCRPEYGPAADFSGDCIVDVADIGRMGQQWLNHDVNFADDLGIEVQQPSDANLVGHYKLDEGNGTFAEDSSSNNYHGSLELTDEGGYSWVAGHTGGAVEFSGGRVYVDDNGSTPGLRPVAEVSVAAWVKIREDMSSARCVVKGRNDHESYEIEIDGEDSFIFQFRDGNSIQRTRYDVNGTVWADDWIHLAGTYDGSSIACYVNGQLEDSKDIDNPYGLSQDSNGLAIGNKPRGDANDTPFEGVIDDVRIYDYGLSRAEVAWLATDGTGEFLLSSPANLFSGEQPDVINFRDFARVMESWLDEQLWPDEPAP